MSNNWDKRRARWDAYKKAKKGMPAAAVLSGGLNSHALAGDFDRILNGWRKAVTPVARPKVVMVEKWEDGRWVTRRQVWDEASECYRLEGERVQ